MKSSPVQSSHVGTVTDKLLIKTVDQFSQMGSCTAGSDTSVTVTVRSVTDYWLVCNDEPDSLNNL